MTLILLVVNITFKNITYPNDKSANELTCSMGNLQSLALSHLQLVLGLDPSASGACRRAQLAVGVHTSCAMQPNSHGTPSICPMDLCTAGGEGGPHRGTARMEKRRGRGAWLQTTQKLLQRLPLWEYDLARANSCCMSDTPQFAGLLPAQPSRGTSLPHELACMCS
jgi:hypothetical protein